MADLDVRIAPANDPVFPELSRLWVDAYPIDTHEAANLDAYTGRMRTLAGDANVRVAVAERESAPIGAMVLYDYVMNLRGRDTRAVGVGSVATALARKRRGIARGLVAWHLADARARGATFSVLYAFRPDFYRKLGYGYGTPTQRHTFRPDSLRASGATGTVRTLDLRDETAIVACHERVRALGYGLIARTPEQLRRTLADTSLRYVGAFDDAGTMRAYMQTSVILGPERTANRNCLVVRDVLYEDDGALAALLGYLRNQRDQFADVAVETQDDAFHLVADDPRDGSDLLVAPPGVHKIAERGLGMMYRLLDVPAAFAHLGPVETPFTLRVEVEDPLFAATNGAWTFRFGRYAAPTYDEAAVPDATLRIGIGDLSSLLAGSVDLRPLVRHQLARVEPDAMLTHADRAFRGDHRPYCTTRF
jgi:predicted acetyltransferase